jgi:hypothetical protein
MTMKITIVWNVTPYSLVDRYKHFAETCCLHLQDRRASRVWGKGVSLPLPISIFFHAWLTLLPWRWRQQVSPKCSWWSTRLHGRNVSRRDARYRCDNGASLLSYMCNINKTRLYCAVSLHVIPLLIHTSVNGQFMQCYFIYLFTVHLTMLSVALAKYRPIVPWLVNIEFEGMSKEVAVAIWGTVLAFWILSSTT